MKPLLVAAFTVALLLANHDSAKADTMPITVNSISGDANSFVGDFSWNWAALGDNAQISGSWAGGTFQFLVSVSSLSSDGDFYESFVTRTTWNDGWIPGGLQFFQPIGVGTVFTGPLGNNAFNNDPNAIAVDYSGLGLQYYLNSTAFIYLTTLPDGSGNQRIIVNISRAVPDTGSTLILMGLGLGSIGLLRRASGEFNKPKKYRPELSRF